MVENWATAIITSLQSLWMGVFSILGDIIGAIIIVIIGLVVAAGLCAIVERIVRGVKFDKALKGIGLDEYFERAGMEIDSGKFLGKIVYWFVVVVFLLAASDILGFGTLSMFLSEVAGYIPNVIIAVLIMLASVVVANFLRHLVTGSVRSARLHNSQFLGSLTWWAVSIFGLLAALSQLGIAVQIINALVTGFVAMLAIAGGIAFGLGGKDHASGLLDKWKKRGEERMK